MNAHSRERIPPTAPGPCSNATDDRHPHAHRVFRRRRRRVVGRRPPTWNAAALEADDGPHATDIPLVGTGSLTTTISWAERRGHSLCRHFGHAGPRCPCGKEVVRVRRLFKGH
jgi:hypothetical protein